MAQYGGEHYRNEEGHQGEGYHAHGHNPTATGYNIGGTETTRIGHSTTTGQEEIGKGSAEGHGYEDGQKHGGILHRTGSGSSSSSEDDGEGGRRKKKGVMEKIKEKLPGGDHGGEEQKTATAGGGYGYNEGEEGHEKKGLMDKIKEKLPGSH